MPHRLGLEAQLISWLMVLEEKLGDCLLLTDEVALVLISLIT